MLKVERIINGILEENCYIIHNNKTCLIVDPGSESNKIINFINKSNLKVEGILITHYHFDHIGALEELITYFGELEVFDYLSDANVSTSTYNFKIILTKGHTMDSCSFYFEKDNILFSGDFLFKGTIGNYEEKNSDEMLKSLKNIKTFNKDIIVYPGHGDNTTILNEINNNPFLKGI